MTAQKKKYDVGILGWWYGKNYGSILTYYGLNRAIVDLGYSVLMVHEPLGYNGYRVKWPDDILSMQFARRVGYTTSPQQHYAKLSALNEEVAAFVVGSDQLWNPLIGRVNDDLFLDFVGPENKRVAYSTSFGNRSISKFKPEFIEKHSQNLKKFDAISVREGYAVNIAKEVFGVDAKQMIDPVFLLPQENYQALADQATTKMDGDYLAVFYLDPNPEKRRVAEAVARKLGLNKLVVIPNPDGGKGASQKVFEGADVTILEEDSPENFLSAYKNSRYVITDSFHGTAFAVMFQKPFSSIYNTHRGIDRFKNLLELLGFGDTRRLLETDTAEALAQNPNIRLDVDFSVAAQHIETERKRALIWLKAALAPKKRSTAAQAANTAPARLGLMDRVKAKYRALFNVKAQAEAEDTDADRILRPSFTTLTPANTPAWQIAPRAAATVLALPAGGAVKGNIVWCDLPFALEKDAAYRLKIRWTPRTAAGAINLHVRNDKTGKFRTIGTVSLAAKKAWRRTDTVEFVVPEEGFTQFMLGAVHFTGAQAGAEIESLSVQEILHSSVTPEKLSNHAQQALDLALLDNERFVKAYDQGLAARGTLGRAKARLMFHAHAIEKGLSRSDFRAGFGKISVPSLAKELNGWLASGRSLDDPFFKSGLSVMHVYFERHRLLGADVSEFRKLFSAGVLELVSKTDDSNGGVMPAARPRDVTGPVTEGRAFLDVIHGRRSVREFTAAPVTEDELHRAVEIAMQAPSVCNRQAARVHLISDSKLIQAAVDLQGGFGGYAMPPKLLLVTCDLTAFLFTTERNQAFIDGGLFMMTLLLGLESVGLGSCSLNTAMGNDREMKIRKLLGIPDNEVFISFVAVGHFDPMILTPRSKRIAVTDVLIDHDKG